MSSGIVKAGDCGTMNLDSNLLIAERVKRRSDTPIRNRAFADGDPAGGRCRSDAAASRDACTIWNALCEYRRTSVYATDGKNDDCISVRGLRGESSPIIHQLG